MTKETPTLEDITKSFYEKCECTKHSYDLTCNTACDYCNVGVSGINSGCSGEGTSMGECVQKYIYEVATGARDINAPLWNPPKVELPAWCKVGQWVVDDDDLTQINEVDHAYIWGKVADRDVTMMQPVDRARELVPVKFRPYESLEELEALLGKKLRFKREVMGGGSIAVETITSVEYDTFDGATYINHRSYEFYLKEVTATIDGLPIGVPVIDKEAMKGDENDE